ncbi:MAG: aminopeptidase, partial [Firmicutes bacterium]|nr:aminopeptidase [Candidatus Caballimonas caccae]
QIGVNLQKGQGLEVICPVELPFLAEAFTVEGYKLGAKIVHITWEDEKIDRLNFLNAETKTLTDIPKWQIDKKNYLLDNNFCYVAIASENPSAFSDCDEKKISAYAKAKGIKMKRFSDAVMINKLRWCVVSYPTKEWANIVFPNSQNAEEQLLNAIIKTMRLDSENPVDKWKKHIETLEKRAEFLNKQNFEYLEYRNSLGTNLKVGLAINHKWLSAKEEALDKVPFVANMPTEEVFTCPHNQKTEGVLYSALPLSYNGKIIDKFSITFRKGKIVDYSAEKGYDTLKQLIETDKGTFRLGEVALIGKNSPIAQSKILFYNTLFDENASCHLAIGKAYPTTVNGGNEMTKEELKKCGVNDSIEHVDFMIGTNDLSVTGIKKDGTKIPIFYKGEWII